MSAEAKPKKKVYKQLERVSITDHLRDKLDALTDQANQALLGVTTITRSDIVNLTIARRETVLSKSEIEELKAVHFDVVKYLSWLQGQAKSAKENGTDLTLKELFERSQVVIDGVINKRTAHRPRKRKDGNSSDDRSTLEVAPSPIDVASSDEAP
jgi:hypothetical protein